MMRWPMVCVAGLLCYGLGGCGDDSANAGDSQGGTQAASSQSTGTSSSSPSDDWRSWDPPTCEAGMMPVFNQTTCQSVGDPCPDGAWPSADGAAEPVLYVAPGGGGDGTSSEAPLGSLAEGLARVGGAGTLLVAKGRYAEAIDVHGRVHIKGACASETIIDVSTPNAEDAVVDLTGTGGSTLENLTVTGARVGVWVWATQEPVNIRGVIIDGATVNGLLMTDENAGAIIENLVVKNTQGSDGNLFDGMGIYIASTGDTTFTNTWLFRNQNVAIDVHGIDVHGIKEDIDVHGLTFQGLVIEETLPKASDQTAGWGLRVATGARVTMTDALLDRSSRQAIDVHGINTELAATRLVVRDTQAQRSDALWGQGLLIGDGAFVMLDDAVFTDNRLAAIDVHGIDGVLEARNIEVRGTKPRATDDVFGVGMLVTNQASARVVNGTFEGNHAMGVWAHGEGVSLTLESTTIENTFAQPADGVGGRGLEIATGAHVTLKGVVLSSNREIGMGVFGEATRVDAEELVVLSTKHSEKLESDGSSKFGYGVVVAGATVNLLDFQLSENASVGLQLLDSSPCVEQFGGLPIVQCADGLISANDIGVNNQLEELPIEEIFSNVIMQDNITEDLSSANLPTGCQSEN